MTPPITFIVHGLPAGQGSKTAIRSASGAVIGSRESNPRTKPFRQAVSGAALDAARAAGWPPPADPTMDTQFLVLVNCYVARPSSHFLKSGALKKGVPMRPSAKADGDKVLRAINDALQKIVIDNDRRVRPNAVDFHWHTHSYVEIELRVCPREGRWVYQEEPS